MVGQIEDHFFLNLVKQPVTFEGFGVLLINVKTCRLTN